MWMSFSVQKERIRIPSSCQHLGKKTRSLIFLNNAKETAQDRSSFCILHIMNEILQHPYLMDTFLVGNHCQIFWEDYQIKCSQHFKKH